MNVLLERFLAVDVHFRLVLNAVGKAARAADTAVHASHTLDKVIGKKVLRLPEKRYLALLYSVAHDGIEGETFLAVFLERLTDGVGKTAASCEYPSVIGRVV